MPYAIDKKGFLDLNGLSHDDDFDVGTHVHTRLVYAVCSKNGSVKLLVFKVEADGSFKVVDRERTVGNGTRPRVAVFSNHRVVVAWLNASSALTVRGYNGDDSGIIKEGGGITLESSVAGFELAAIGITTGVQQAEPGTFVHHAYRNFAITARSVNGGWKLFSCMVRDSADVALNAVAAAGSGDKIDLACTPVNEAIDGKHPRKAMTLYRDVGQIKTRTWRLGGGVTSLATAGEPKALGYGALCGLSMAQNNDFFAVLVWPGASNDSARLQLIAVDGSGAMSVYGSADIEVINPVFARLQPAGSKVAVAYLSDGKLAVAAWDFRDPGGSDAVRTVLASKVGVEQPTQVRLATIVPDAAGTPTVYVTLSRVPVGGLRLVAWELTQSR